MYKSHPFRRYLGFCFGVSCIVFASFNLKTEARNCKPGGGSSLQGYRKRFPYFLRQELMALQH